MRDLESMKKSETSLILEQWHEGDPTALDRILEKYLPWVLSQVRQRLTPLMRRKAESGDYAHEAIIQFLRFSPKFTLANDAQFRALLLRIVESSLHNKYDWFMAKRRELARERPLPTDTVLALDPPRDEAATPTPDNEAESREEEAWVRLGMEFLEADDREVIFLRNWSKLPFREIGERMKISTDAARMRYGRAVRRLGEKVFALRKGCLDQILEARSC